MIDIANASQSELDAYAVASDLQSGERALNQVHRFLGRFVAYPSPEAHDAHALWIMHTHLMPHWDSTPRLAFLSAEPGSGKTRALEITSLLVPRPVLSVNVTPAYLFRKIGSEDGLPTLLYDEIDTVFGPKAKDNEDVRGLLNAGHHKDAKAGRCVVRGKTVETEELPAYCAVAMAGLGWLPDTILTRSVILRMRRRAPGEAVEPFRRRVHTPQAGPIYHMIESWARTVTQIDWPNLPPEIQDRDADVWEPLVAIADIVGGSWPARARKAAIALVTAAEDAEPSLGIRLLADCKATFEDKPEMPTKELLAALVAMPESPWSDLRGKPLDERGLAKRLKQYGIRPTTIRIGTATPRGYRRVDFGDAWSRYLAPASPASSATSATSATVLPFQRDAVADVADSPQPSATRQTGNSSAVAHVADVGDLAGPGPKTCAHCGKDGELTQVAVPESPEPAILHDHCIAPWLAGLGG